MRGRPSADARFEPRRSALTGGRNVPLAHRDRTLQPVDVPVTTSIGALRQLGSLSFLQHAATRRGGAVAFHGPRRLDGPMTGTRAKRAGTTDGRRDDLVGEWGRAASAATILQSPNSPPAECQPRPYGICRGRDLPDLCLPGITAPVDLPGSCRRDRRTSWKPLTLRRYRRRD